MKRFVLFLLISSLVACSTRKVTEVSITNENDHPITVTLKANNCSQSFKSIDAHSEATDFFDWTEIEKKDGQWVIFVQNDLSGRVDSFSHGYFQAGELSGYAQLVCKGSELKIKISE